jgi:uncharacterized protein
MADDDTDGRDALRRAKSALGYAWLGLIAALLCLGIAVSFFGTPADGARVTQIDLRHPASMQAQASAGAQNAGNGLSENSAQGPLPRIADDGRTPMQAYAGKMPNVSGTRVAIVISGLGISAKMTQAALDALPAEVTLAFSPYVGDVRHWAGEARKRGHEVLIELPMEPYDFPDSDPGQYTLRVGADPAANMQRLNWALSRLSGYAGTTNLLGARFLTDRDALRPVLDALAKRGLLFFDNGAVARSAATEAAAGSGVYFTAADEVIDTIQSAMEIDRQLDSLTATAKAKGAASGAGFVYPVTVERVSLWSKKLYDKGVVLVPLSAIVSKAN